MAYIPETGSVVAFQSDPTKLVGTVSVVGTIGASVIGSVPVVGVSSVGASTGVKPIMVGGQDSNGNAQIFKTAPDGDIRIHQHSSYVTLVDGVSNQQNIIVDSDDIGYITTTTAPYYFNGSNWDRVRGNSSVGALVSTGQTSVIAIIQGSVATVGTAVANQSVSGTVGASIIGHAPVVIVGGSILTSSTPNQSVSGEVSVSNFPAIQNIAGSVATWLQSNNASIITVGSPVANQSVSGTVGVGNFPVNQNVSGSIIAFQGTPEWTVKSSIAGGIFPISGSVAAVVTNFPTSQNVNGSVVSFQGGGWKVSVLATISPTATVSSMKAIASTTTLLASNAERKGAMISNISGTSILVKLGNMSDVNNNSFKMNDNDYYETPFNYSGVIQHFASSTAGFIQVTEIT